VQSVDKESDIQHQDAVIIDLEGRYTPDIPTEASFANAPLFHQASGWQITLGEKDVVPAIELCVKFMNVGETALVWSHSKYALGIGQRQHGDFVLPAEANVTYRVTLVRQLPDATTPKDDMDYSRAKKQIANDIYTCEWIDGAHHQPKARAYQLYRKATEKMQNLLQDPDLSEADTEEAQAIIVDCLNNLIALHLRAKEYKHAKDAAVRVLQVNPDNFKALIRAAKAALLDPASSFEEVEAALEAADAQSEDPKQVAALRAQFRKRKQAYEKKSREMYGGKMKANKTRKAATIQDASDTQKDSKPAKADEVKTNEELQTRSGWKTWPWKERILPYGFQVILPFIMYGIFTIMKNRALNDQEL